MSATAAPTVAAPPHPAVAHAIHAFRGRVISRTLRHQAPIPASPLVQARPNYVPQSARGEEIGWVARAMEGGYAVAATLTVGGYGVTPGQLVDYHEIWRSQVERRLGMLPGSMPEYMVLARGGTRGGGGRFHTHSTIRVPVRDDVVLDIMREAWLATTAVQDRQAAHPAVVRWADDVPGWVRYSVTQRDPDTLDRRSALGGQYGSGVVGVYWLGPREVWAAAGAAQAPAAAAPAGAAVTSRAPAPGRPEREAILARRFLVEMRRRSIASASEILRLAAERGQFCQKTLNRVKRDLGIRSISTHDQLGRFVHTWIWPSTATG